MDVVASTAAKTQSLLPLEILNIDSGEISATVSSPSGAAHH